MLKKEIFCAKNIKIESVTKGPYHHFFGFHDLVQTNAQGDLVLGLEVDVINRPPYPGEKARAGVICSGSKTFQPVHETSAFNFPQGARQQWIGESDDFICNDMVGDQWGSRISDARSQKVLETLDFPTHCLDSRTGDAFYIDYRRLYFAGVYGYVGLPALYPDEDIPAATGIFKANIKTKENKLLVSVNDVASCGTQRSVRTGYPHYLTHLALNPSKSRLAFLHRYRVIDGGETTRLMSVGVDGRDLRCLAKGFLSHFDWLDDENIFIWGVHQGYGLSVRENRLWNVPGAALAAKVAKGIYRGLKGFKGVQTAMKQSQSFLKITDSEHPTVTPVALDVLTVDGHPMVCPANRDWMVNDTYPDNDGFRTLMLYNVRDNKRFDLGRFEMSREVPDEKNIDCTLVRQGMDMRIQESYPLNRFLFSRSGLHCDLHPRWSYDGRFVYFDSIHKGMRQIYRTDVSRITGVGSKTL